MSGFSAIDLSRLPAPEVIRTVSYDALFEEMRDAAIAELPEMAATLQLESEPATKILRVCAYLRMLDRLVFNDGARASMLALATGPDLDQLAAFWGVERRILQEADDSLTPPVPEIRESDAEFRRRVQLSLEGHSTAGPAGAYLFWALSADPQVLDASVDSPAPGQVEVTVLARDGDGTPDAALIAAVEAALSAEDVRPLTDQVSVLAPTVLPYTIEAALTLLPGPDSDVVLAAVTAAVEAYVAAQFRLGRDVTRSGLFAALHQPGVQNVILTAPAADLVIAANEVAALQAPPVITVGGRHTGRARPRGRAARRRCRSRADRRADAPRHLSRASAGLACLGAFGRCLGRLLVGGAKARGSAREP